MRKVSKTFVQDVYVRPYEKEVLSMLKYGYTCSKEDVLEAFDEAADRYQKSNYHTELGEFKQATLYERGEKLMSSKYDGRYQFCSLWPWQRWRMKRNGEYKPLPKDMDMYWVFLVLFIENNYGSIELIELREQILMSFSK